MNIDIETLLFSAADREYAAFSAKLIPNIRRDVFIGVRSPVLRRLAREMSPYERESFLSLLPHCWHEENMLHAYIINLCRDYRHSLSLVDSFLPYVDNWAVCDSLRPVIFSKEPEKLMDEIHRWLSSEHEYTRRFALEMLMCHYLDEKFSPACLELAATVRGGYYYVEMMQAWYFATALAKQWDSTIAYFEKPRLSPWVHQKSIQKAIESRRLSAERKGYLRTLKIPAVDKHSCQSL